GRDSRKPTGGIPDAEVRTKSKLEALQHPATMFPLSLSIISAVYLGMLSPLFGGWLLAAGVCAVSALAAVASYRFHYAKTCPRVDRELRDHEKEEESRSEEVELSQAQDVLRKGFLNIASEEGTMVLSDLVTEYEQLRPAIAERRPADPFSVLDQEGVGELIRIGIERGRKTRPALKVGICGEHGGEPSSVEFCHRVGMTYVSCSPFMIPVARLAAAQARIREKRAREVTNA
ncbi:MAG: hypothetical protein HYW16_06295, partial [Candidatus Rokubacteria bacterium]|nr:hypothetical protein [Candidatus Rokubacteria bacterium]